MSQTPFDALLTLFHDTSPYDGFDPDLYPEDLQGWGSNHPVFEQLILETRPTLIIEVGSWKGASAIHMGDVAKKHDIPTAILCLDTWLGNVDHWYKKEWREHLGLKHGYPTLYYQFLANVIRHGHSDTIIPFAQPSQQAVKWLQHIRLHAQLIYVDGAHEAVPAFMDMREFWQITTPGGVMFGDDYNAETAPGVVHAVAEFSDLVGQSAQIVDNKWVFRKPK
jgi:hypothetical protein